MKESKSIYPSEHQNDCKTYMAALNERGLTARFERIRKMVEDGTAGYSGVKVSPEMYMKLVNERHLLPTITISGLAAPPDGGLSLDSEPAPFCQQGSANRWRQKNIDGYAELRYEITGVKWEPWISASSAGSPQRPYVRAGSAWKNSSPQFRKSLSGY